MRCASGRGESFAAAWQAAFARPAGRGSGSTLYERGVEGVLVPYFYGGLQRGEYRHYDDGALRRLLRFGARSREARSGHD